MPARETPTGAPTRQSRNIPCVVRTVRPAVLLALALAAVSAAPAPAALETVLQDDATLLYRSPAQTRASMARLASLGVDRVRLTANWSVLTRDPDSDVRPTGFDARNPAAYEQERWRGLDQAVDLARAAGLNVLIDIGFWAPHWATHDPPGPRARTDVNPQDFADFAVAVARRYSGAFVPPPATGPPPVPGEDENLLEALLGLHKRPRPLPPPPGRPLDRVDQFALWNEPNQPALLMPQWHGHGRRARPESPILYGRMLRAAYPAAKAQRPDATFLVGNTASGGSEGRGGVPPLRFIRALACVDRRLRPISTGACAHFSTLPGDGWAHHPYTRNERPDLRSPADEPDDARIAELGKLSRLLRRLVARGRLAPGLAQIHITEFGLETGYIPGRPRLSPATQARWLTWAEYLASRVPGVVSFAQFLLRDQPPGPVRVGNSDARGFGQYYTGLLTAQGRPKPAASQFVAGLFAQNRPGGRVMLWVRMRLPPGLKLVEIQRRDAPAARWRRLLRVWVDGRGSFTRVVAGEPGARYRLRFPRPGGGLGIGMAIAPVGRGGGRAAR